MFGEEKYQNIYKIVTGSFVKLATKGDEIKLLKLKVNVIIRIPTNGSFLTEVIQRAEKRKL